jgi:hypothetical protein
MAQEREVGADQPGPARTLSDQTRPRPAPHGPVIDSQAVKTTPSGGPRGYDGGKKIKGRKRQALVDTEGTLLKVKVHPADLHDKVGGMLLLHCLHLLFPTIVLIWADTHYQGLRPWATEAVGKTDTGLDNRGGEALVDQLQPAAASLR